MKIDLNAFTDQSYFIKEMEVDPTWVNDLGPGYHEYRKRWKKADQDQFVFDFPLCLEVESSYACNLSCPYCPRFASATPQKGIMKLETFKKLAEECTGKLDSIFLDHGGEPLLNKNFVEFVNLSREARISDIMMSTNATVMTPDISRAIIQGGITKINFSLDAASRETYAKTRPGFDYDVVIKNIEAFMEEKKRMGRSYPRVRVSFIVQDANRHEVEPFYNLWKDKVNMITFQKLKEFKTILADDALARAEVEDYPFKCSQIFTTMMVNFEGGMHLCNYDYDHKYALGHIGKESIYECWKSATMKRFRDIHRVGAWKSEPFCSQCVMGSV